MASFSQDDLLVMTYFLPLELITELAALLKNFEVLSYDFLGCKYSYVD